MLFLVRLSSFLHRKIEKSPTFNINGKSAIKNKYNYRMVSSSLPMMIVQERNHTVVAIVRAPSPAVQVDL
jgi:hypothetical protein